MTTKKDAESAVASKKATIYKDIVPLTAGMFSENTKISKEKMIATVHRSVLGLTKTKEARPIEDLKLFLVMCNQYSLNPFKKEIYATYVWDSNRGREELTPIVAIHGLRKICRGSKMPTYTHTGAAEVEMSEDGKTIISATVPVFGHFGDGKPVEITRYTAMFDEFARTNKEGALISNWARMPRVMIVKCAEANALRQGFDISGIYIEEEITSDTVIDVEPEENNG